MVHILHRKLFIHSVENGSIFAWKKFSSFIVYSLVRSISIRLSACLDVVVVASVDAFSNVKCSYSRCARKKEIIFFEFIFYFVDACCVHCAMHSKRYMFYIIHCAYEAIISKAFSVSNDVNVYVDYILLAKWKEKMKWWKYSLHTYSCRVIATNLFSCPFKVHFWCSLNMNDKSEIYFLSIFHFERIVEMHWEKREKEMEKKHRSLRRMNEWIEDMMKLL